MMLDPVPNPSRPPDSAPAFSPRPQTVQRHHRRKSASKKLPQRGLGVAQLEKLLLEEESKQEAECRDFLHHLDRHITASVCPLQEKISPGVDSSSVCFNCNGASSLPLSILARRHPLPLPFMPPLQGSRDYGFSYGRVHCPSIPQTSLGSRHIRTETALKLYEDGAVHHTHAKLEKPLSVASLVPLDAGHPAKNLDDAFNFESSVVCETSGSSCRAGELSSFQRTLLSPKRGSSASNEQACKRKRPWLLIPGHHSTLRSFKGLDLNASVDNESEDQGDAAIPFCIEGATSPAHLHAWSWPQMHGCMQPQRTHPLSSASDYLRIGSPLLTLCADNHDATQVGSRLPVGEFLTLGRSRFLNEKYGFSTANGVDIEKSVALYDSSTSCHPKAGKGPSVSDGCIVKASMEHNQTRLPHSPQLEFFYSEHENYVDHCSHHHMLGNAECGSPDLELRLSL